MSVRAADPQRSRIVLVGTPAYTDPGLPDVPVVANNVADLAAALTDAELGGFDPEHCAVAPAAAGVEDVGDLLVRAADEAEDLLLFYYSGHGLLGPRRRDLYLTVAGTRPGRLAFTGLPFDAVRDAFLGSRAANRVVILDSCFSGRAIGETLADDAVLGQIEVAGTYTLSSAPANRTALILPGERHTAFTGRLLQLLRTGSANAGALLSLGDIYRHLHARLRSEGLPEPQYRGTATADLLGLARNRHFADTVTMPARTAFAPTAPAAAAGSLAGRRVRAAALLTTATELADRVTDGPARAQALAGVVKALARVDPDQAERLAETVTDAYHRALALAWVAAALATSDPQRAGRLVEEAVREAARVPAGARRAQALVGVVKALADVDPARAEQVARTIADAYHQAQALTWAARASAPSDPQRAIRLAEEGERAASGISAEARRAQALIGVVKALAQAEPNRAERLAAGIPHTYARVQALVGLAKASATTDRGRAERLGNEAERLAATLITESYRAQALMAVAKTVGPDDADRAEHIAASITQPSYRAQALGGLAKELGARDPDRAEQLAGRVTDGYHRAQTLAGIAQAVLPSDPDRARRLGDEAERVAWGVAPELRRAQALAGVAKALAGVDADRAARIAAGIPHEQYRAQALTDVAAVWLDPG